MPHICDRTSSIVMGVLEFNIESWVSLARNSKCLDIIIMIITDSVIKIVRFVSKLLCTVLFIIVVIIIHLFINVFIIIVVRARTILMQTDLFNQLVRMTCFALVNTFKILDYQNTYAKYNKNLYVYIFVYIFI